MKTLYPLLCLFLLAVSLPAQEVKEVQIASAQPSKSSSTKEKTPDLKKGGIELPPEKARPVAVPKFATAIVIDGKPDEEAWKDAAVFKDFYQTNPGNNVAPSKPTEVLVMYDEK